MRRTLAQWAPTRVVLESFERFQADDADTHAAALAYQLFLSTLALSIGGLAVLGMIAGPTDIDVPEGAEEQWRNLTQGGVLLGIAALLGLLWTSSTFGGRATRALGTIFRTGPSSMVRGRLRGLAVALGVIVLIGALPVLTGVLTTIETLGGWETPVRVIGLAVTVGLEFALFLGAYVALTPTGGPGWRVHVPGALLMTAGWEIFKLVGGLVLAYLLDRSTLLYGTLGAVVTALVLMRAATWLLLFGAEVSAVLAERGSDAGDNASA